MKSITFLMPGKGSIPVGGFKVVFEYANRLQKDGYDVHIVYPVSILFTKSSIRLKIKQVLRYPLWNIIGYSGKSWFKLEEGIREHISFSLNYRDVPKTDFYVATAVLTSTYLRDYPISNSRKLYLIQDFEDWLVNKSFVYESYNYGLKNIAISNWLAKEIKKSGAECTIIKNGFDFTYFQLSKPIEQRDKYQVSMLYHFSKRKGCNDGIEALSIVKKKYPGLKVSFFGTIKKPDDLPDWIDYYQKPDRETHNRIYNESSIYLAPSHQEGWGLTVGEAMICGAAIVCTDTLGFKEMVEHEMNGLICEVGDIESLANNMIRLIENDELRIKLATKGNQTIKQFCWESSFCQFKSLLSKHE